MTVCMAGVGNVKMGVRKDTNEKKIVWVIGILVGNHKNLARKRLSRHESELIRRRNRQNRQRTGRQKCTMVRTKASLNSSYYIFIKFIKKQGWL